MSDNRLPRAHPRFLAHFASPIYDPDNDENDDLAPFGTDAGFDDLHDWARRLDDLRANPTLRYMRGEDADAHIGELRRTRQVDVDDILIGQVHPAQVHRPDRSRGTGLAERSPATST